MEPSNPILDLAAVTNQRIFEQEQALARAEADLAVAKTSLELEQDELRARKDQRSALIGLLSGDDLNDAIMAVMRDSK